MTGRRAAAAGALAVGALTIAWALFLLVRRWPVDIVGPALLLLAAVLAWWGIRRRGARRTVALGARRGADARRADRDRRACGAPAGPADDRRRARDARARAARVRRARPAAARRPAAAPVLFINPRSGDGRAERTGLAGAARERGIEVVTLEPGDDLNVLVEDAVARGADGLAMAGGDGSQAIVARIAAAHGLPYACIPSGTRNHFALDLGVDRDDDLGALDAFGPGAGEHVVDLAEVNGRTFVNNVSLGVYAEAVQREGYRAAKVRTILDTVPDVVGPDGRALDLEWTSPSGTVHHTAAVILVSNNRYRLGGGIGAGTRPRIDDGLLGVAIVAGRSGARAWVPAPVARMVDAGVRGPLRRAGQRRHRRRDRAAGPAAALRHPRGRPARPDRAAASRAPRRRPPTPVGVRRGDPRAGADRGRAAARCPRAAAAPAGRGTAGRVSPGAGHYAARRARGPRRRAARAPYDAAARRPRAAAGAGRHRGAGRRPGARRGRRRRAAADPRRRQQRRDRRRGLRGHRRPGRHAGRRARRGARRARPAHGRGR